ncbi:sporulation protein Cse60 [Lactiplantibacillus plantarum]|nr:sporulation protein Cse60 [Lactiplantibacillus plantarum]
MIKYDRKDLTIMIKTKTIMRMSVQDLDRAINRELANRIDSDNVIDIKFSSNAFGADLDSSSAEYCAMIIYK